MILPVLRPKQRKGPPTPAHQQLESLTNLYPRERSGRTIAGRRSHRLGRRQLRLTAAERVVCNEKEVVQDSLDEVPAGDPICDRVNRVGGDQAPLALGTCHCPRAGRLDRDHSTPRHHFLVTCPTAVASAPPPRARRTVSNGTAASTSSRPIVPAPSQVSRSRLSLTRDTHSDRAMSDARSRASSWSASTNSRLAPMARIRSSLRASRRAANTVTPRPHRRPD